MMVGLCLLPILFETTKTGRVSPCSEPMTGYSEASLTLHVAGLQLRFIAIHANHSSIKVPLKHSPLNFSALMRFSVSRKSIYKLRAYSYDFSVCSLFVLCRGAYSVKNVLMWREIFIASVEAFINTSLPE